jgi:hypothetical protein
MAATVFKFRRHTAGGQGSACRQDSGIGILAVVSLDWDERKWQKIKQCGNHSMIGENLDLHDDVPIDRPKAKTDAGRHFVGIHFLCCEVYSRVYLNRQATAYEGNCPKCARPVRLSIGPGGTDTRFFTAE